MAEEKKRSSKKRLLIILLVLFIALFGIGVFSLLNPKADVPPESVLVLPVKGALPEISLTEPSPFSRQRQPITLQGTLQALRKAKTDDRIKLVLMEISVGAYPSKINEVREAIKDFRASGKEVWAYLSSPDDNDYHLAAACDKIFLEPFSSLSLDGIKTENLYFKTALEKIGIGVEVFGRGKYKSATEPLVRDSASAYDIEQRSALLDDFFNAYVADVAKDKNISEADYRRIIDEIAVVSEQDAVKLKLVDSVLYLSQLKEQLKQKFDAADDALFVSAGQYAGVSVSTGKLAKEKIAVVNVVGTIVDGKASSSPLGDSEDSGDQTIVAAVSSAQKDESIKAIVLRVDSPGGSVLASDKILNALNEAKKKKPLVVSMSGLAASGGYWISMNANKIIADPLTITGSIGVFSVRPYFKKLQENAGLHRQVLTRGKYADALNMFEKASPDAFAKYDELVGKIYKQFLAGVADGRKMTVADVDSIAQGRVWTGQRAKAIRLVDELGGFRKAIQTAKELAGIDTAATVQLVSYPAPQSFLESLFGDDNDDASLYEKFVKAFKRDVEDAVLSDMFGTGLIKDELQWIKSALKFLNASALSPQARLPYDIIVK